MSQNNGYLVADVDRPTPGCATSTGIIELDDLPGEFWVASYVQVYADESSAESSDRSVVDPWRSDNRDGFGDGAAETVKESLIDGGANDAVVECSRVGSCIAWFSMDHYVATLYLYTYSSLRSIDPNEQDAALLLLGTYAQELVEAMG